MLSMSRMQKSSALMAFQGLHFEQSDTSLAVRCAPHAQYLQARLIKTLLREHFLQMLSPNELNQLVKIVFDELPIETGLFTAQPNSKAADPEEISPEMLMLE